MQPAGKKLFLQVDLELAERRLPPRLLLLYGRLRFHAGKDGRCHPKLSTLAREIGLRTSRQVINLLDQLEVLRLVRRIRTGGPSNYVILDPDVKWISHQMSKGLHNSDVKRVAPRKEGSSSKDIYKRGPLPPTPSPQGEGGEHPKPSRRPVASRPVAMGTKTQSAEGTKDFDDEKTVYPLSPKDEFRRLMRERHGTTVDAGLCLKNVTKQLWKFSISLTSFLAFDHEQTTAPALIVNPMGYYTQLAKDLRQQAIVAMYNYGDDLLQQAAANQPPEPERDQHGRCKLCGGLGLLADGAFCSCSLGRDLKNQQRLDAKKNQEPKPDTHTESP